MVWFNPGSIKIVNLLFSFVDYVPVKGEIIWYLSFTTWLISLSIMLSSSIHAIAKGISSFFLSAASFNFYNLIKEVQLNLFSKEATERSATDLIFGS